MKHIFILIISFLICSSIHAQDFTKKDLKNLEKAEKYFDKEKFDKSIDHLFDVIEQHPFNAELWDMAVSISKRKYDVLVEEQTAYYVEKITESIEKNKSTTVEVEAKEFGVAEAKDQFLRVCYIGSLKSRSELASMNVRIYYIDREVDSLVSEEARAFYNDAETHFYQGEYEEATDDFKEALSLEADYYMATLSLGDTYYTLGDYDKAIYYFLQAKKLQPDLLQPRKYLADAYLHSGDLDKALEECIDGILTYPDVGLFNTLEAIAHKLDYDYENIWLPRMLLPNIIGEEQSTESEIFMPYREAKEKIVNYCDDYGIIVAENDLAKTKYLEVYSWRALTKSYPSLDYLRPSMEMDEDGYLDCYLLISLFHVSVYEQFRYLVEHKRKKAERYIRKYYLGE